MRLTHPTGRWLILVAALAAVLSACGAPPHLPAPLAASPSPTRPAPASATASPLVAGPLADYRAARDGTGLPRHPLDPAFRPLALHGPEYVAQGPDGDLYLMAWADGRATRLTRDGRRKDEAVLSDDYVAWTVGESAIPTPAGGADSDLPLVQIVVLDRRSGAQRTITQTPAPRRQLALDGRRLVWADKRNEPAAPTAPDAYYAYDIYAFDLVTGQEYAVAVAPGVQDSPAIHGDVVVWRDNRNRPRPDTTGAGCDNCRQNRFDLYLYDFRTGRSRALVEDPWLKTDPATDGAQVVWAGYGADRPSGIVGGLGQADLYALTLSSGPIRRLTATADSESAPVLAGNRVLWTVRAPCDVIDVGPDGKEILPATGAYVADLTSGAVWKLTGYKEPFALFDGRTVLISEGCGGPPTVYAVALP